MKLSDKQVKKLTELHAACIAARAASSEALGIPKSKKGDASDALAKFLTSDDGRKAIEAARDVNRAERDALRSLRKYVTKLAADR